jgi:hypothetical protein
MMNWKGFGGKQLWSDFKALSRNSLRGTEDKHGNLQSGQPVSGLRLETGTSRI